MVHKVLWICLARCLDSSYSRLIPTTFLLVSLSSFLFSFDFKLASYNVENLFDMEYSGHEYREYIPNRHNWNRQTLSKKLLNISEVICEINADIIGLQEIENSNILHQLQQTLRRVGCRYRYRAITHKKNSAIQVAILSKIPIQATKEIVVKRALGYRNILEVKYLFDHKPLYIYVNHWKSKSSKEAKRIVSARALVKRLQSLPKESEYILLGDFNSDYNEYIHIGRETGINHILKTIDRDGYMVRESTITRDSFEHYNLWLELPNYKRWSHNFYGDKQALDSIIIPYSMVDGKGVDYIKNSFYVIKKHYLFHKKGYIFRWVYKNGKHRGEGYSDHLPIVASFSTDKLFKKKESKIYNGSIEMIYKKDITFPILLQRVKVVEKEKNKILIEDIHSKKTISIYGTKDSFILGEYYDIRVYKRKLYKDKYEIIDFEIEKRYYSIKKRD